LDWTNFSLLLPFKQQHINPRLGSIFIATKYFDKIFLDEYKKFMTSSLLIRNGQVIVGDPPQVVNQDVLITAGRIVTIGHSLVVDPETIILDATDKLVSPGFIQTHIHLCQTLFRGAADDLALLDWLKLRIWPLEAAHDPDSISAAAELAIAEMIKGGTTAALTMETVHHTAAVLQTVARTGFRATVGKCMMDKGDDVPSGLQETTDSSLTEVMTLREQWPLDHPLVRVCFAPRFAVSCTTALLQEVAQLATQQAMLVHTHASENRDEVALVAQTTGQRNVCYLERVGLTGPHLALAHCVHVDATEQEILARSGTQVLHCPSSNLKLGSGIAPIYQMLQAGIAVSLGADGAACNNNLDIFAEMRLAALLQKALHGAEVLPAATVFRCATLAGAQALGLERELGSIEVGKRADIVIINLQQLHCTPAPDPLTTLVYAARSSDVETVIIEGQIVMQNRQLLTLDEHQVMANAQQQWQKLLQRAGL
jgi:5-methylthioadenosine/S-adenosylhomocysteine deaminase